MVHWVSGEAAGSRTQSACLFVLQTLIWQTKDERITFFIFTGQPSENICFGLKSKAQDKFLAGFTPLLCVCLFLDGTHCSSLVPRALCIDGMKKYSLNAPDNRTGWYSSLKHSIHSSVHHLHIFNNFI